jgi:hypothetical protein
MRTRDRVEPVNRVAVMPTRGKCLLHHIRALAGLGNSEFPDWKINHFAAGTHSLAVTH